MHIYILYSFISVLALIVAFLAYSCRRLLRELAVKALEAVHMINISAYDQAVFVVMTLSQKVKKGEELTTNEQEYWHKARRVIHSFERDYKVRKTYDENISSSTVSGT